MEKKHHTPYQKTHHTIRKHVLHKHDRFYVPLGIKVLAVYCVLLGVFYLLYLLFGLALPTTLLFGRIVQGPAALLANLVITGVLAAIIYGMLKRKAWAWELSLAWFLFGILNSLFAVLFLEVVDYEVVHDLALLSFVMTLFINGVIIWYLFSERNYFKDKEFRIRRVQVKDKLFLYGVSVFWILIFLMLLIVGLSFFQQTVETAQAVSVDLQGKLYSHSLYLCGKKGQAEADVCYLVLATKSGGQTDQLLDACSRIESDFYKFTCIQAVAFR